MSDGLLALDLLSAEMLAGDTHPELNVRLVISGISHNRAGSEPPRSIELRLSETTLDDLEARIASVREQLRMRKHVASVRSRFSGEVTSLDAYRTASTQAERMSAWQRESRRARDSLPPLPVRRPEVEDVKKHVPDVALLGRVLVGLKAL